MLGLSLSYRQVGGGLVNWLKRLTCLNLIRLAISSFCHWTYLWVLAPISMLGILGVVLRKGPVFFLSNPTALHVVMC